MKDYCLKPEDKLYVHPRASDTHGLTYDVLLGKTKSLDMTPLLNEFVTVLNDCYILDARKITGDLSTINNEFCNYNMENVNVKTYRTMHTTKQYWTLKNRAHR